jgi:hypothetical protein
MTRIASYVLMGFGAMIGSAPIDPHRALPWVSLARAVCRDPDPGYIGPALERVDSLLAAAERTITAPDGQEGGLAFGQIHAAATIAATELVEPKPFSLDILKA